MNLFSSLVTKASPGSNEYRFENYRDYRFLELGRFDYTKEDCYQFHEAVKLHVMPLVNQIYEIKRKNWDWITYVPGI